ncbi:MAG: NADH-quinone oxidoreductase subunit NuoK [Pseudomonadota bacterium]
MAVAVPFDHVLLLAATLFLIGLTGVMVRRNVLFILMSLELMLNGCGLAFVAAGARWGEADGQVMYMLVLALAAAEAVLALALTLQLRRRLQAEPAATAADLNIDSMNELRG